MSTAKATKAEIGEFEKVFARFGVGVKITKAEAKKAVVETKKKVVRMSPAQQRKASAKAMVKLKKGKSTIEAWGPKRKHKTTRKPGMSSAEWAADVKAEQEERAKKADETRDLQYELMGAAALVGIVSAAALTRRTPKPAAAKEIGQRLLRPGKPAPKPHGQWKGRQHDTPKGKPDIGPPITSRAPKDHLPPTPKSMLPKTAPKKPDIGSPITSRAPKDHLPPTPKSMLRKTAPKKPDIGSPITSRAPKDHLPPTPDSIQKLLDSSKGKPTTSTPAIRKLMKEASKMKAQKGFKALQNTPEGRKLLADVFKGFLAK